MSTIKLALQREGRLSEGSTDLLHRAGLEFDTYRQRLFATCRNFDVELLFVRDDDIPEYVADGVADLGIVGRNLVREYGRPVEQLIELGFGYCSLVLAVPNDSPVQSPEQLSGARISTSYPNSARAFFQEVGVSVELVQVKGSVELTPALGVADAIVELTATGSTLRINDLRQIANVYDSQAILVANAASLREAPKRTNIDRLVVRVRASLAARAYKYVMFNAPRSALDQIRDITPGLKSPTIVDLAEEGWVAVHTAIDADRFWDTIERLRELGASELLVTPIESMIL